MTTQGKHDTKGQTEKGQTQSNKGQQNKITVLYSKHKVNNI